MKYRHRVLGMLSLLAIITYLDRVCIAVAGPVMQDGQRYRRGQVIEEPVPPARHEAAILLAGR